MLSSDMHCSKSRRRVKSCFGGRDGEGESSRTFSKVAQYPVKLDQTDIQKEREKESRRDVLRFSEFSERTEEG